ncbi:exported protein of unknown function [Pseudorhizobium banfieldiae]|uniref:Uncharacterized protein n=1 Tax=Pseudorhizobium banfieldiae TaxID=1125847 RepID=L0NED2_9HYPH|nr:hypothetical protein [Pseudorhizobium banfieldiae]CAD6606165.1 hypothetical protein RNT25_01801 [arsenite-oxidising bacterium NT-25]CCF19146.1 exported protein of unknown function [Pseudorhizobium banfieldiae]
MKKPIPYTYVVARRRRRTGNRWCLAVMLPGGLASTLDTFASRKRAISTAKLLAYGGGHVEVRP